MNPLVTVITAVYNDEKFIRESVESILAQTYKDLEYIVVDDGSSDRTWEILSEISATDARLILISQQNKGAASARNMAISKARGKYIAIQDSDDISEVTRIEKQVMQLENSQKDLISCTGFYVIGESGELITSNNKTYQDITENVLNGSFSACHPTMMFKKNKLVEAGGYNTFYNKAEDYDLILRLIENDVRISKLNICLYNYRIRSNSEGSMNNGEFSKRVYQNHLNRIKNLPEDFSTVTNTLVFDKNYLPKRYAHELFFSENYSGYKKHYLSNLTKLFSTNFLAYFIYASLPDQLRKLIKTFLANGIRTV